MENKTIKTIAITALIVAIGGLTLGYAALNQVLNITTDAKVQSQATSWNVKFVNPDSGVATGDAVVGTISLNDSTVTVSGVVLKAPGDTVTYTFDVTNAGDIDAQLSTISMKTPTIEGTGATAASDKTLVEGAYTYTITYQDGTPLNANDDLLSQDTKKIKLTISLKDTVTQLPQSDVTISNLGATLTYIQK